MKRLLGALKILTVLILLGQFTNIELLNAQVTPGLIIVPATGALIWMGIAQPKTNGIQSGFTIPPYNYITQSEIPYIEIEKPDPRL